MAFDDLKGIQAERTPEERDASLVRLIEYSGELFDNYFDKFIDISAGTFRTDKESQALLEKIKEDLRVKPEFTESDLKSYIFAKVGEEYEDDDGQHFIGIYTGLLLEILTERNRAKGKRTRFHINGQGNEFDDLFYGATNIDDLIVENFKGFNICTSVGTNGTAGTVIVKDIEGGYTLHKAGGFKGRINNIIAIGLEGDHILEDTAKNEGRVDLIITKNIRGKSTLLSAAYNGSVDMIVAKDIIGNGTGIGIGHYGESNIIVYENLLGKDNLFGNILFYQKYSMGDQKPLKTNQLLAGKTIRKYMKDSPFCKILELIDSLQGKNAKEVYSITKEIRTEYEQIGDIGKRDIR